MRPTFGFALPTFAIALAAVVTGCSSSQDKTAQGSLAVKLSASRPAALVQGGGAASDDPLAHLLAASVTISEMEARRADGTWVPVESGFPAVVDLLALADGNGSVSLRADLLPEGQYGALQVRISQVELTVMGGARVTIAPPGTGWSVLIPVDFGVVTGEETTVSLIVRLDRSFRLVNGQFEFEPEVQVEGVEHG